MDAIHLAILGVAVAVFAMGARMMYCGHRGRGERRRSERRMTRRAPGRRAK